MATAPSPWTCLDGACNFAPLYPDEYPPWRRAFGLGVLVVGVVAVLPLPLFVSRSRHVFALYVRQPITVAFLCAACLISLVTPYRYGVVVPCSVGRRSRQAR